MPTNHKHSSLWPVSGGSPLKKASPRRFDRVLQLGPHRKDQWCNKEELAPSLCVDVPTFNFPL